MNRIIALLLLGSFATASARAGEPSARAQGERSESRSESRGGGVPAALIEPSARAQGERSESRSESRGGGVPAALIEDKKIIAPEGSDVGLPFSPGVLSGDFLYLAGAIGNKPGTLEVPEGIEAQMRQAMANLDSVLKAAGMDFSRAVSVNVYLSH